MKVQRQPPDLEALEPLLLETSYPYPDLKELWPEAQLDTFRRAAPAEAVVACLIRGHRRDLENVQRERRGRLRAEQAVADLRHAAEVVLAVEIPEPALFAVDQGQAS